MRALLLALTLSTNLFAAQAPEFVGLTGWINSEPTTLQSLRGKVVLIDFWDYSCINCIRTLPHLNRWYKEYGDKGFTIVGIHTPEFAFEHDIENVKKAVKRFDIHYPVALDNDYKTWRAYNNKYWPTSYLVDKEGTIRLKHIGEGKYLELENAIRELLALEPVKDLEAEKFSLRTTPEIYLGSKRAENYTADTTLKPNSVHTYTFKEPLKDDTVGLKGLFRLSEESITSAGSNCSITLNFHANKVHMVLSGTSQEPITLILDGKPLSTAMYTEDMTSDGKIFVDASRKYDLIYLSGEPRRHTLQINLPPAISCYSFTFG